jgi:thiamine-phosphate diphosphorylase
VAFQGRPLICLVTNRRRLAGPHAGGDGTDRLVGLVATAARAGIDLVHVREVDLPARELSGLVRRCVSACAETTARVVVNDRIDIALAAGAAGVHLRADGVPAARVRAIAPARFLIGRSVHSAAEGAKLAASGGLDYLVLGTVFPSTSKDPEHPLVGIGELERLAEQVDLPVLAIGGITAERAASVARTGAAGVAAISLFLSRPDEGDAEDLLRQLVSSLRSAFDSAAGVT